MTTRKLLAIAALVPFSLLTVYTVIEVGYIGIFDYIGRSPAGWQVFADLVIALLMVLAWLVPNARATGRNPWLWVAITLTMGCIGPLLYIALEPSDKSQAQGAS